MSPGARKLNLAAARRRRPVSTSEWERRDMHAALRRTAYKTDCIRDLANETWQLVMEARHDMRQLGRSARAAMFTCQVCAGALLSAAAGLVLHYVLGR